MKKLFLFWLFALSIGEIQAKIKTKTIKVNNQSGFQAQIWSTKTGFKTIPTGSHTLTVPHDTNEFTFYYHGPTQNCGGCMSTDAGKICLHPALSSPSGWQTDFNKTYRLTCKKPNCCP